MALLKQFKTDHGTIRVTRSKHDGSLAYFQNGCFHSQSNRHGISICGYVHAIVATILQARAKNILIIGCAGGTLATMLRRLNIRVTAVDINPAAFVIARRYFRLPDDVHCISRDGIAYIRTTSKSYDAIVIDVFASNNQVPRSFTTKRFFQTIKKALPSTGIMIMNVITASDRDRRARQIARTAQSVLKDIKIVDWPGQKDRNTLITAGVKGKLRIPSGREPAWIVPEMKGVVCYAAKLF